MNKQSGLTLIEALTVLAVGGIVLVAVVSYAVPILARETMRSAIYGVQTNLQLARIESISRNRPCRFVVNTSQRTLSVFDSMGTPGTTADDLLLYSDRLPSSVSFARPDVGAAVTLQGLSASTFQAVFNSDGTVSAGAGNIALFGGERYLQVSLFLAGGLQVQQWNGSAWAQGS